jgi:hypothetical protein
MPLFVVYWIDADGFSRIDEIQAASEHDAAEWIKREYNAVAIDEVRPED